MTMTISDQRVLKGRFRLLKRLGKGAMGTVWLADDTILGRAVAVKELIRGGNAADLDARRNLAMREAMVLAKVRHPAIVSIYDVILEDDDPWIVMEYINGTSLAEILSQHAPLDERVIAIHVLPVLHALAAAHRAGVVHRDIKPENIVVGEDGAVSLVDFGIAQVDGVSSASGEIKGTPEYLAPERLHGEKAGTAADLWSVGVMLYYAREGRFPFGYGAGLDYNAIKYKDPLPLLAGGGLGSLIMRLLHKEPAERPSAIDAARIVNTIPIGPARIADSTRWTAYPRPRQAGPTSAVRPGPVDAPRQDREQPGIRALAVDRAVIRDAGTDAGAAMLLDMAPQRAAEVLIGYEVTERSRLLQGIAATRPRAAGAILDTLGMNDAARTLKHLSPEIAASVLGAMPNADGMRILRRLIPLDVTAAAAAFMHLPVPEAVELLRMLPVESASALLAQIWPNISEAMERVDPDLIQRLRKRPPAW
jgi:predicted Ser/Thr protein kinase